MIKIGFVVAYLTSPWWSPFWLEWLGSFVNRKVYCFSPTLMKINEYGYADNPYTWFESAMSSTNELKGFPPFLAPIIGYQFIFNVLYGTIGFPRHLMVKGRK